MPTTAETIFDVIRTERDLEELRIAGTQEDLYLEFKQRSHEVEENQRTERDKAAFSKAISGFANADGGVLIFGVATTKGPDGIDRVHALRSFADYERFAGLLSGWADRAAQFPVAGIRVATIRSEGGDGYVRCLIPKSDKAPHRAFWGTRTYWRRTAIGHQEMEHYEIADAFGVRVRPALELELLYQPARDHRLDFYFRNVGRGIAKHAGLFCRFVNARVEGVSGRIVDDTALNNGTPTVQAHFSQEVVHCVDIRRHLGSAGLARDPAIPLRVAVKWYAENMEMRSAEVDVPADVRFPVPWQT